MTKKELEQLVKDQQEYIQQLEDLMSGVSSFKRGPSDCSDPIKYCDSCSCGKKDMFEMMSKMDEEGF